MKCKVDAQSSSIAPVEDDQVWVTQSDDLKLCAVCDAQLLEGALSQDLACREKLEGVGEDVLA